MPTSRWVTPPVCVCVLAEWRMYVAYVGAHLQTTGLILPYYFYYYYYYYYYY